MERSPGAPGSIVSALAVQVEIEALGLEVLHQERGLGERRALHVGIDADPPRAAHRIG